METEGKEEVVDVVTDTPANAQENHETGNDPLDEVHATDYSELTKKELVDLLKTLVRDNDFKKPESSLRALRNKVEEIQHQEKTDALKRFLEQGGTLDDFDYRLDVLDIAFEANFKLLRNKRLEHFRNLEEQKNGNFRKKTELLDALRELVDGKDDKHSFDKFKEIQKAWKETGAVPVAKVRPLWASYHALVDRFYDNRTIYFELKELDRKKNLEAKIELCQRAEKLAEVTKINVALRELHELHEEYKHIGPVSREDKEALWDRFKKATDAVYERRDAIVSTLQVELKKHLALKEEIIAKVAGLSAFQSDRIKEWNQKTVEILALQKSWEGTGAVPRSKSKDINKKFWSGFKSFFSNKGKFFSQLDESRTANLEKKRALVKQAEELKNNKDGEKTTQILKDLQVQWKEIGPVPDKMREKIYQEFKAACDFYFEQRRGQFEAADREQAENLKLKEALCVELDQLIAQKSGTLEGLRDLQRRFQAIGFVPRQSAGEIKSRFTSLFQKAMASLDITQADKDQAILEIQLESIKSDPDAGFKLQQREHGLKKRIQKEENDIAVLKNNLEFFGRSKNADKMREEFGAKIKAAEEEIANLKKQLKQLRAALRGN
ncbi:MAG: DUF349 domain-containing protein [Cyclobacteriaceae bacterium]|nr:DUF349 domain-containing protein [Cyclobacteriaceae bacterium]